MFLMKPLADESIHFCGTKLSGINILFNIDFPKYKKTCVYSHIVDMSRPNKKST